MSLSVLKFVSTNNLGKRIRTELMRVSFRPKIVVCANERHVTVVVRL